MSRADKAEELFRKGYNCGQSVFAAFADVTGMTLAAGYLRGYDDPADAEGKKELYRLIQKMCAEFEAEQGSIICRELLGLEKGEDIGEPAVRTEEYYRSRPCVGACRTAAAIAEKYLLGSENG